ncbi:fba [Symbiodinium microadriaticum]|nr:fba [Symbiodinium microadriaticum]
MTDQKTPPAAETAVDDEDRSYVPGWLRFAPFLGTPPPLTRHQWSVMGLIGIVNLFEHYDMALLATALKQIQEDLNIAEAGVGIVGSIVTLGAIFAFLIAPLADRFGRRRVLVITIVAYTLFTGLTAIAPNTETFVIFQFLARVFATVEVMLAFVVISEELDPEHRGWGIGAMIALGACGTGLAFAMFALVDDLPGGWRALYAIGLVPLLFIAWMRRSLPETKKFTAYEKQTELATGFKGLMTPFINLVKMYPGRFAMLAFVAILLNFAHRSAAFFGPKYFQEVHLWTPGEFALMAIAGGFVSIMGATFMGKLSDRIGRKPIAIAAAISHPILGVFFYQLGAGVWGFVLAGLWVLMVFLGMSKTTMTTAYGNELFPTSYRTTAASALTILGTLAGSLALLAESGLYVLLESHWDALSILITVSLLTPLVIWRYFPETALRDLEDISPEKAPELMTRYAHHIDHREFDDYCSLFTEEMHLEMPGQKPTTSRETLRKGLDHRPVALESRHVITNMRVIPTSDVTATGLCYLSLYRRIRKGDEADDSWALERPAMIGEYHDDYVKSDEGWRYPPMKPGVVTGSDYQSLIKWCRSEGFALPAVNVTSSSTMNAAIEAAAEAGSDIIIQLSGGGAQFFAGQGIKDGDAAKLTGAISAAQHAHAVAEHYGVCVALHTDHANRKLLPWVDGMISAGEAHFEQTGRPLYSSHMIDLSDEPMEDNLAECEKRLARMAKIDMTLEIELGITGGEEDGVGQDLDEIDNERLYTQPEHVVEAWKQLSGLGHFSVAAAFGNVHGVYKPGNVQLRPEILKNAQALGTEVLNAGPNPFDFVFHGGSGSEEKDIKDAISYGVFKINIDTDTQFAYSKATGAYVTENPRAFLYQIDPDTDEPYKSKYDPRKWVRKSEQSMVERLQESFTVFGARGKSLANQ